MTAIDKEKLRSAALGFGLELDAQALERFDICAALLAENSRHLNLTAITEPEDIIYKHFIDSLLFFTAVNPQQGASIIDVGTGAGFPGLPLLIYREDLKISFLDSTEKKLKYIERVLNELGLKAKTVHARAEELGRDPAFREAFDWVTARAVAPLRILLEYCLPLAKPGGKFVALKAKGLEEEMDQAEGTLIILKGSIISLESRDLGSAGARKILVVEKTGTIPSKYPRTGARIKKNPL